MNLTEKRWHPLLREWVVFCERASERPWQGAVNVAEPKSVNTFEPSCQLCPSVVRASGIKNPDYQGAWSFVNDFAVLTQKEKTSTVSSPPFMASPAYGVNKVICYSPDHGKTVSQMTCHEITDVICLWIDEFRLMEQDSRIKNILIFENKGAVIGASNPHPHAQLYATDFVPKNVKIQRESFSKYFAQKRSHLLMDILKAELTGNERVIYENRYFASFVPFFARFSYESHIVPKRQFPRLTDLTAEEVISLADIIGVMAQKYDALFSMPFPNSIMIYSAPCKRSRQNNLFNFHIEYYPPLRDRQKIKHVQGFDFGGGHIINYLAPETAAAQLRNA